MHFHPFFYTLFHLTWFYLFSVGQSIPCTSIPMIPNAELNLQDQEFPVPSGSSIEYQCSGGYHPVSFASRVVCENGTWLISKEMCRPANCGYPGVIENAYLKGKLHTFPNNVTYVCNEGYKVKGNPTLFCMPSGVWNPSTMPSCEAILCPSLVHENGTVLLSDRKYNSIATYKCNKNYHLEGDSVRVCQMDGTWNGSAPTCVVTTCPIPSSLANLELLPARDVYISGDVAIFRCKDNQQNVRAIKCLEDGMWQAPLPQCAEITTSNPKSASTSPATPVDKVETTTDADVFLIKDSVSCDDPGDIRNGKRNITGFKPNNNVTYHCEPGYTLRGQGTLICLYNGKWNLDKLPICVKPVPTSMIIGLVLGTVFIVTLGISGFSFYEWRARKLHGYGKKSKALAADATDLEEIAGLEKETKPIPVTVL